MKIKVLKPASRASLKVKNLDRRRKLLNFFLVVVLLEHAWLAWTYEKQACLDAVAKLVGGL